MRARERRISGQNGAGELQDYDSALYNDTSRTGDGAEEAGGKPMRYTRYRYKVFFYKRIRNIVLSNKRCTFVRDYQVHFNICRSMFIFEQIDIDGQIFMSKKQREERGNYGEKGVGRNSTDHL